MIFGMRTHITKTKLFETANSDEIYVGFSIFFFACYGETIVVTECFRFRILCWLHVEEKTFFFLSRHLHFFGIEFAIVLVHHSYILLHCWGNPP